jgi:hypothetical protein
MKRTPYHHSLWDASTTVSALTSTSWPTPSMRKLFIQGAQVLLLHLKRDQSRLGEWIRGIEVRRHRNVAAGALANKLVRICWKMLATGAEYRPYRARQLDARDFYWITVLFCDV